MIFLVASLIALLQELRTYGVDFFACLTIQRIWRRHDRPTTRSDAEVSAALVEQIALKVLPAAEKTEQAIAVLEAQ